MAFQLSPGVNVSEIDLTTIVPSVATSIGAFAGPFAWGPVGEIITISDEVRLADTFGKPDSSNYEYWFSAANFLAYTNNLKIVRAYGIGSTFNATANSSAAGVTIKNDDDWDNNYSGGANTYGHFAARYAGAIGNSLRVSVADANTYTTWTYSSQFTAAPSTSTYVSNKGGATDEIHIIVVDEDGLFTGTRGTVLEKFGFVSKAGDAKDDSGNTNYYKNVLANKSKYIHWLSHPSVVGTGTSWGSSANATSFASMTSSVTVSLTGGADGTVSVANVVTAYDSFDSAESVDIALVISGPANQTLADSLISMAETRKDCVVFLSPEKADVVDNAGSEVTDIKAYRDTLTSTSYAVLDGNWKYQYDKYNDVNRWVPLNGDVAGLCTRTD